MRSKNFERNTRPREAIRQASWLEFEVRIFEWRKQLSPLTLDTDLSYFNHIQTKGELTCRPKDTYTYYHSCLYFENFLTLYYLIHPDAIVLALSSVSHALTLISSRSGFVSSTELLGGHLRDLNTLAGKVFPHPD